MLNVTNINVYYGNIHALHDMTFHVDDGEIVSLIGANGAGKSTSLKTISGLLRSHTGDIEFDGHSISRTEPDIIVRQGLTHVPEGRRIFLSMTVEENLDMGAFTIKEGKKKALDDVFDRFPRLAERRNQIAGTLSGGEQQMLAMGRALMIRPKMMMLDEPSMGLAPILVSPKAARSSVVPKSLRPSACLAASSTSDSRSVAGARFSVCSVSCGSGSRWRSVLPLGSSGSSSNCMQAVGTMYAARLRARWRRSAGGFIGWRAVK